MELLREIHKMIIKLPKTHDRNFTAKHAQRAGAGVHKDKEGSHAPRTRQKQQWKKDIQETI